MKENVIISLADSNYFELLNELVDSIKRFKESNNTAICIMDAGLTDDPLGGGTVRIYRHVVFAADRICVFQ